MGHHRPPLLTLDRPHPRLQESPRIQTPHPFRPPPLILIFRPRLPNRMML